MCVCVCACVNVCAAVRCGPFGVNICLILCSTTRNPSALTARADPQCFATHASERHTVCPNHHNSVSFSRYSQTTCPSTTVTQAAAQAHCAHPSRHARVNSMTRRGARAHVCQFTESRRSRRAPAPRHRPPLLRRPHWGFPRMSRPPWPPPQQLQQLQPKQQDRSLDHPSPLAPPRRH